MPRLLNVSARSQPFYALWSPVGLDEPAPGGLTPVPDASQTVPMETLVRVEPQPPTQLGDPPFFGYDGPQSNEDTLRVFVYLFRDEPSQSDPAQSVMKLFWQGPVRYQVALAITPETETVLFHDVALTEAHLARARQFFSDDRAVASVSAVDLAQHAKSRDPHAKHAVTLPPRKLTTKSTLTPCEQAIGAVAIDAVALACGLPGIAEKLDAVLTEQVAEAVRQAPIAQFLATVRSSERSELPGVVVGVIGAIGSREIPKLVGMMLRDLTTLDKILYGAILIAEGALLIVTDGVAEIGILAAEMVVGGYFIGRDLALACQACDIPAPSTGGGAGASGGGATGGRPVLGQPVHLRFANSNRITPANGDPTYVMQIDPRGYQSLSDVWVIDEDKDAPGKFRVMNRKTKQFLLAAPNEKGLHAGSPVTCRSGQQGTDASLMFRPWSATPGETCFVISDSTGVWGFAPDDTIHVLQRELNHDVMFRIWVEPAAG